MDPRLHSIEVMAYTSLDPFGHLCLEDHSNHCLNSLLSLLENSSLKLVFDQ